jgi:pimeloyl-ACP methyl ester carboxylesterase
MIEKLLNDKLGFAVNEWPLPPAKTPIIFVHGAGGSHLMWLGQLAFFKKEFNPVAVNLPGHNLSPGPARTAIKDYAEFVIAVADALKLERFLLTGLSMGGAISQYLALHFPERIIALALLSTGARLKVMPDLFKIIRNNWNQYLEMFPQFAFSKNAPKAVVEQSLKELTKIDPLSVESDFRACDGFDVLEQVKNISLPTLIISADQDLLTPPKYSDYLASQIKGSRLVRIANAGHIVNLEKPTEVNHALAEFFKTALEKK